MYFLIIVGTNKGVRGNCVFVRRVLYWKWPQNIAIMRIFKKDSSIPKILFPISKSEVRTCQKSCCIGDGKDDRHNQRTNVYMCPPCSLQLTNLRVSQSFEIRKSHAKNAPCQVLQIWLSAFCSRGITGKV